MCESEKRVLSLSFSSSFFCPAALTANLHLGKKGDGGINLGGNPIFSSRSVFELWKQLQVNAEESFSQLTKTYAISYRETVCSVRNKKVLSARDNHSREKKTPFFEMDHPPLGLSCFAKKRRENWSNFASALAAHVFLHLAC